MNELDFTTLMLIKSNVKPQHHTAISIYFIRLEQLEAGLVILLILGRSCSHICVLTVHSSKGHSTLLRVSFMLQQTNWQKREGQSNHSRASWASIYNTFSSLALVNASLSQSWRQTGKVEQTSTANDGWSIRTSFAPYHKVIMKTSKH